MDGSESQSAAEQPRRPDLQLQLTTVFPILASALVFLFIRARVRAASSKSSKPTSRHTEERAPAALGGDADASAKACWARLDGRFKHCGLRADPYDSRAPPPRYSLVNLPLTIPSISEEEQGLLDQLTHTVSEMHDQGFRTDAATLLRFLRARKGNVPAAEAYFRQACRFRQAFDLNRLETHWNLEAYSRCFAPWWVRGGIIGHGLQGQIVGFERFGRSNLPELLEMLPVDVLQRLDAVHMVGVLAAFEEDSLRTGRWLGNAILILDLDGLGWNFCTPKVARSYAKIVEHRDMLMPCTLDHVFVIRAPKPFAMAWSMFQHLLDPVTREKVQIVSGNTASLALLRRYISNDVIPAYLGGGASIQGDPEGRLILGSSGTGPTPKEAVARLLQLIADGSAGADSGAGAARSRGGSFSPGGKCVEEPYCGVGFATVGCAPCPRRAAQQR